MTWTTLRERLQALDITLFHWGDADLKVSSLLTLVLLTVFLFWFAGRVRWWVAQRLLRRVSPLDEGSRLAIGSVARYAVLVIGLVMILQNVGLNLGAFTVVAGALGVGVGFGLQNVFSNFISGLIIMIERPIKVGDRVELANLEGTVREIGARRTTVITHDNVAILVPNQKFITDNVVSLAYTGSPIRLRVPVQLPSSADEAHVRQTLLEVAQAHPDVLPSPAPEVLLVTAGGGAMSFELAVWHAPLGITRQKLGSDLNYAISHALRQAQIQRA